MKLFPIVRLKLVIVRVLSARDIRQTDISKTYTYSASVGQSQLVGL